MIVTGVVAVGEAKALPGGLESGGNIFKLLGPNIPPLASIDSE